MTAQDQTTIRRNFARLAADEIEAQRTIYLSAYEELASSPTEANWKKATDEFKKLMDIKALYIVGKQTRNAFALRNQRRA